MSATSHPTVEPLLPQPAEVQQQRQQQQQQPQQQQQQQQPNGSNTTVKGDLGPIRFKDHVVASNLYQALNLSSTHTFSQAELRQAYLRKAALFHPDKHPTHLKESAAMAFSRISLAFRTLSDPTMRQKYDKEGVFTPVQLTKSTLASGDKVFNALEEAKAYSEVLSLIHQLPSIEAAFSLPTGSVQAIAGEYGRCTGRDCDVSFLAYPHLAPRRVLLCRKHLMLHQCDHRCTQPDRICLLWAAWHINKYRHEVQTSWSQQESAKDDPQTPAGKYWFNARAGISRWCVADSDEPPTEHVTPHTCTIATCGTSGYTMLDPGIFVCRASGTGHLCTSSQCRYHWRKPIVSKKQNIKSMYKDDVDGALVCWATGRPITAKFEDEMKWESSFSVTDRPKESEQGLEQRVITYQDERTGLTVQQLVERSLGSTIGEAVDDDSKESVFSMRDSVMQETHQQAHERDAEGKRLARLRQQRQDDFGADEADDEDQKNELEKAKEKETSLKRKRHRRVSSELSERQTAKAKSIHSVRQIRESVKTSLQRLRDYDYSGSEGSEDEYQEEEDGGTYNAYNVLDEGDYNREEIGDYNTQYTLAGGVEAIEEEAEEYHDHEHRAREEYLEYAHRQFLEGSDPKRPMEWYGDPAIGNAHPDNGALRVYDGRVFKLCERPPTFKPPNPSGFERTQLHRQRPNPRVRSLAAGQPRSRANFKRMAHRLAPRGSSSPDATSRETSPTPSTCSVTSGGDRMEFDTQKQSQQQQQQQRQQQQLQQQEQKQQAQQQQQQANKQPRLSVLIANAKADKANKKK